MISSLLLGELCCVSRLAVLAVAGTPNATEEGRRAVAAPA